MNSFDYILGVVLLGFVLWNMRPHELTDRRLRRPLIIAAAICVSFLHGVPIAGADGVLVALGILAGLACGAVSARFTRVEPDERSGVIIAAASPLAIGVTAAAFVARMAFAVAATNGLGPAIARFSSQVGIHSAQAWVAALVLMAATDLSVRALMLWRRRVVVRRRDWTSDLVSA